MQIKLSYKLFAAFFLILAIVVGALFLSRYLFSLNFKRYIHQVEVENLQQLVPVLQTEFRSAGGWEGLRADASRWQHLLNTVPDIRRHAPPPPPHGLNTPNGSPPRDMPPGGPTHIMLVDGQGRPVIGTPGPGDQDRLVAIQVDGQTVGWLGLRAHEPFASGPPAALLKRQARDFYLLGAVVIGLTGMIAFLFSRHLLRPIQRLARGTLELARRNFTVRIPPTTRDELGRLAENFNTMAATLENYERTRRQWLTDISHELRTPLAVLRGEIEALQDGVRAPSSDNLASLHAEILRISKLVEDLHLLSMADSDTLHLKKERVSPCELLETTLESYHTRLTRCGIAVETTLGSLAEIRITGDADRLVQVFTNVLENTCKYVRAPGRLEISGTAGPDEVRFYFQDSGPGVPDDALPRLFDRLYRIEASRSRASGGSGLGLSICLQIIEGHNGRMWAEKSVLGGLSIAIALPVYQTHHR